MEHNSALVPEKLIHRNVADPTPIFDDDDEEEIDVATGEVYN